MDKAEPVLLFSYGTLQEAPVQRACFGRLVDGEADRLAGHRRSWIETCDPAAADGPRRILYPILDPTSDGSGEVAGRLFELTEAELAAADAYEGVEYRRVRVRLRSDRAAWVYVRA